VRKAAAGGLSLAWLVRVSIARPGLTVAVGLVLTVASSLYTARALTFQTSSVKLLPPHHLYVQRFQELLRDFGELNDLVVVVEAPTIERAKAYADRLATEIKTLPEAGRVSYRIDPDLFKGQALLYLSLDKLGELRDKLVEHRRFIEQYAGRPTVAGLLDGLSDAIARRFALGFIDLGLDADAPQKLDAGFIDGLLAGIADDLDGKTGTGSPWVRVFTSADEDERSGYFLSSDKKLLFMLVEARREEGNFTDNQHLVAAIRRTLGALRADFADVAAGVTGTPALSNDEMLTAFHDSTMAGALAFALTLGILLVVFRRVVEPLLMLGVLQVSLAWALGIITAVVGHLTIFSVMFISLLIGIGIDYGIYVFFRYEEELGDGRTPAEALEVMAIRTGPGILFGALTAAGTFGVLMLAEFRGIQEFGFIAAISILTAFLAMMTVFPAVLMLLRRRALARAQASRRAAGAARERVSPLARLSRYSTPILVVSALLTVYSLTSLRTVRFDYNRLNLQAKGSEAVIWERKIMASRRSGFAALTTADSLPELREKRSAFENLPGVSEVVSLLTLIPADQDAKGAVIRKLAPLISHVQFGQEPAVDLEAVRSALEGLRGRLELGVREADPGTTADTLRSALTRSEALLARLQGPEAAALASRLPLVQARLRDDFVAKLDRLRSNLDPRPLTVAELPGELTRKFVASNGRLLMRIYPAIDTWDRDGAREFVAQLRSVDPAVTGSPVVSYEASRLMEAAYFYGTLAALVVVAALAFVALRRPLDTVLALVPLTLGTLWTIGAMRAVGLPFNLANVWGLPLIVGAAAEYGLIVALRHQEGGDARAVLSAGTVTAVLLNGLTTLAGFGSLMVGHHQGIVGLGVLLTIGTVAGLVASLVVQPALLRLVDAAGVRRRQPDAAPAETGRRPDAVTPASE
jgi:hopanoid biosynthesis associated RND transporter like protein HpnN